MRYIDLAQLQRAIPAQTLIWLSDDDSQATAPNLAVIEEGVRSAEDLVDGYIASRYALPLASVPTVLADIVVVLARYWLYSRRPEGPELPEAVTSSRKAALAQLSDIQAGKLTLAIATTQAAQPERGRMEVATRQPMFGASTLDQY